MFEKHFEKFEYYAKYFECNSIGKVDPLQQRRGTIIFVYDKFYSEINIKECDCWTIW